MLVSLRAGKNEVFKRFLVVLLRCHFFQGRSVSVGVSVKKSVVGLGFGVYTRAPSATVRFPRRIVWHCGRVGE